jgi:hypothetical protein
MNKKELVVIGAYPNTDKGIQILKECILSFKDEFDILLCTHHPADKEIQSLVDYYIYDIRNELVKNSNIFFWADYPAFYCEIFDDKTDTHHSFAVYRQIMNAINFAKDYYDSFFYVEGDCIFDKSDIEKLKVLKSLTKEQNKESCFFYFPEFLSTLVFYSTMDFFVETFPFTKTVDEYNFVSQKIGSYGVLENFLYRNLETSNNTNKILKMENMFPTHYFENSKLGLNSFFEGQVNFMKSFKSHIARVEGTDDLVLVYVNNNTGIYKSPLKVKINGKLITEFPNGNHAEAVRINPENDNFVVSIEDVTFKFNKEEILKSRSFVRFK